MAGSDAAGSGLSSAAAANAMAEAPPERVDLKGDDGFQPYAVRWQPSGHVRAVVALAHGMGEHVRRYDAVASVLAAHGYAVYGKDHRGHGRSLVSDAQGDLGVDGWNSNLADMRTLVETAQRDNPGVPTLLLGHSMGAMLSQQFVYRYGYLIDGVALSGSPGFAHPLAALIPTVLAYVERWRQGHDGDSELLQGALFGKSNEAFDSADATGFEWLSRDAAEVRKYVTDADCGFVLRAGSLVDLFNGAREAARQSNHATIPQTLPVYVFSGSDDPVHGGEANLTRLVNAYRKQGLAVELKLYPGGRHELFNETNRTEVIDDLLSWLDGVVSKVSR
ncbi:MAG: alpha/beta fold hydrolase [Pseudomonadota bacterium]